jgi:hypothetical protein
MKQLIRNIALTLMLTFVYISILGMFMVVISSLARADQYDDALGHAKDAFLEQSGANTLITGTEKYFKTQYVDPYGWSRAVMWIGGAGFYVYKHREVRFPVNSVLTINGNLQGGGGGLTFRF